jgi:hypothetical protein
MLITFIINNKSRALGVITYMIFIVFLISQFFDLLNSKNAVSSFRRYLVNIPCRIPLYYGPMTKLTF